MLFNTFDFLFLFFPLVTCVYYLIPHAFRWIWLLGASIYFYSYFIPYYLLILALAIVIDYSAGIFIEKAQSQKQKKIFLILSILSTILILFVFKYYDFAAHNINRLGSLIHENWKLELLGYALPVGLSFHTFQSLSYVIEVYRGNQKAERHFGIYSLYVMFYPQLVAGPIERPQNMLHQFYEHHKFDWQQVTMGLRLLVWGLFKKVVIADNMSGFTSKIFENHSQLNSPYLYWGAFLFSIQIYCDFSGYSDIAIGTARSMGFRLMENFNLPYCSQSIKEFWTRWHISLSTWFKDYVYIPLGGSRASKKKTVLNQSYVFLLSGIWHGANWTFLAWGALHALFNAVAVIFPKKLFLARWISNETIRIKIKQLFIFHLVLLAWIFFRANSITDAIHFISTLLSFQPSHDDLALIAINRMSFFSVVLMGLLFLTFDRTIHVYVRQKNNLFLIRSYALFSILVSLIVTCGFWGKVQFIYFQF